MKLSTTAGSLDGCSEVFFLINTEVLFHGVHKVKFYRPDDAGTKIMIASGLHTFIRV